VQNFDDFFVKLSATTIVEAHKLLVIGKEHPLRNFWDHYNYKKAFF